MNEGTTTSSPGPTPSARSASVIASVPLATPTACRGAQVGGELGLERRDLGAEDERAAVEHLGDLRVDLAAQRRERRLGVEQRDRHRVQPRSAQVSRARRALRPPCASPTRSSRPPSRPLLDRGRPGRRRAQLGAGRHRARPPRRADESPTSGQCTANFVFFDASDAVYIGQAAHCTGTGGATGTDGCDAGSLPLGTPVEVDGASRPGTLAYNSWLTMQANGRDRRRRLRLQRLRAVKLDPADYGKVNPSIPFWGGPTGIADTTALGDKVLSYGNSSLRLRHHAAEPEGGPQPRHRPATAGATRSTPSRPASPATRAARSSTATGKAFGTLSTVQLAPEARRQRRRRPLARARLPERQRAASRVQLAQGTEAFTGSAAPVDRIRPRPGARCELAGGLRLHGVLHRIDAPPAGTYPAGLSDVHVAIPARHRAPRRRLDPGAPARRRRAPGRGRAARSTPRPRPSSRAASTPRSPAASAG